MSLWRRIVVLVVMASVMAFMSAPAAWAGGDSTLLNPVRDRPRLGVRADPVARSALAAIARTVEHAPPPAQPPLAAPSSRRAGGDARSGA